MELKRVNFSSGAPLEDKIGYSRMVKIGPFILVGGTTSVQPDGSVYGEGSAYEQAKYIFEKQVKLLEKAGASAKDVVKIEAFVTDISQSGEIGKAYSEIFHDIRPLFTMVEISRLNRPAQLVEIEMNAIKADEGGNS